MTRINRALDRDHCLFQLLFVTLSLATEEKLMDPMMIYIEKELVENPDLIHLLTDLTAEKINVGEEFRQLTLVRRS